MRKIYHLSTCQTCRRILAELDGAPDLERQDIKTQPLTPDQLDELRRYTGSYEALFSRRSRQYRPLGLHEKQLTEEDYRRLILEEYTFLNRPVVLVEEEVFVGSSRQAVEGARRALNK